ncbi:anhydro-N-acetylmuramic acid kinase [Formosa sp. Hel1_31_208]|uniref:anhydro-N-acetylmuramic acid kinase n=1 Tax=Formosa sp. Hel1_31_208 TaxID=1798225 RepID=UPI00087D142A|nr:anhydro-N-acetylmuramic acid kinase [Formosa sp. Hel1_31_208]SDR65554.1 anhydro-N-acetylmuramic acid kinase [Formosa sp. Hel1_31_208]
MIKSRYNIIGVMSGTSLDGIDLAHITLEYNQKWTFKIHEAETVLYSKKWLVLLKSIVNCAKKELDLINIDYTDYLGETIQKFINDKNINELDAICSHGHTALHRPENGLTYQIGNHPKLAQIVQNLVVCDFRIQDVKLGGQGAPLVPIGDRLLFSDFDYCINLGGFANISSEFNTNRIAYDICPVNIVMNRYAHVLGFDFDDGGVIAKSGVVNQDVLNRLNTLSYYKKTPPKSLGLEWVEKFIFPILEASKLSEKDILRTVVEHVAIQIAKSIKPNSKVLITGGGTYNSFLLERIKVHNECHITIPSKVIIEYKEALIFGLLGVLKLRNEINCLSSVTGAKHSHSSGEIYYP